MRLVTVQGTMGSGKTSLIKELVGRLHREGRATALVENEEGEVRVEPEFKASHNLVVEKLRGG
ncbi:MAG: hypothetical protein KQJ78_04630 [Deltaproteobacteria bacterium]|nr:hypothetical protein [Deltaproteobacteria bacterium]